MFSNFKKAFHKKEEQQIRLNSQRCYIKTFKTSDAEELTQLLSRNKFFWSRFEPIHRDGFYTNEVQRQKIVESIQLLAAKREFSFGIYDVESDQLIGHIALYAIKWMPYSSAFVGYSMDEQFTKKGIASEAVQLVLHYAFHTLQLHRVEAYVAPDNTASIRVLEKNGFKREGLLRKLLYINGYWIDHYLYAILAEEYTT